MADIVSMIRNVSEILFKFLGIVSVVLIIYAITLPDGSEQQTYYNIGFILMIFPRVFDFLEYIMNTKLTYYSSPGKGLRNDMNHAVLAFSNTRNRDIF